MQSMRANEYNCIGERKICWTAIFGGVIVAIVISLILNLLGVSLGFGALSPDLDSVKALSSMALIWLFAAGIIAMFMGGWVASALSGSAGSVKGYWQGFIVAGLAVGIMAYLATSAFSSIVGGTFSGLSSLVSSTSHIQNKNVVNVSNGDKDNDSSKTSLAQQAKDYLPSSMTPLIDQINYEADLFSETMNEEITNNLPDAKDVSNNKTTDKLKAKYFMKKVKPALSNFLQSINTDNYDQARKDLIQAISEASGKPTKEIEDKINEWQKSFETAKAKAAQLAEDAANKTTALISQIALINFLLILVSVVSAGIGGVVGSRHLQRFEQ